MTAPIANLKGAAASAAPRMAISASDASREAELAAEEDVSDVATGPGGPPPVVEVAMTQRSFAVGEIVTAGSYRIGNPSDHGREVELKTWVEGPGLEPVPVWGFGAEEAVRLSARHHEDYGPLGLFDVSAEMPAGTYRFNARAVDPVTGDVLCEDGAGFVIASEWRGKPALERRHAPALLANMEQWRELAVTNAGGEEAAIEVKIWLESQGRSPIAVLSVGGDGSLVLAPNAAMTFDPLAAFDPPAGSWTVRYRILDPATARVLMEQ
jgi:hypothetical protein